MLNAALHASPPGSAKLRHPENGLTPAHLVVRVFSSNTSIRMIDDLVAAGCDPNALAMLPPHPKLRKQGSSGPSNVLKIIGSPLSMALCYPHSEACARHLLSLKSVESAPVGASPTPLHLACAVGASASTISALLASKGTNALKISLQQQPSNEADAAGGRCGDSMDETPGLSGTPLHAAAAVGLESSGKSVVVELLLNSTSPSSIGELLSARDVAGRTALQVACICDQPLAASALLNSSADADLELAEDNSGKTALHLAIDGCSQGCVEVLVGGSEKIKGLVTYGKSAAPISLGVFEAVLDEGAESDDGSGLPDNESSAPEEVELNDKLIPRNAVIYAESVQSKALGPCRLLTLGKFDGAKNTSQDKDTGSLPKASSKKWNNRDSKSGAKRRAYLDKVSCPCVESCSLKS
jgi:ankyrin repeat protein